MAQYWYIKRRFFKVGTWYWWLGKQPCAWDEAKHLQNPEVNTATEWEHALSVAVAEMLKAEKR